MIWDAARWDETRLALVRRLAALRREEPALRAGRYVSLAQPGADVVAFARVTDRPADTIVCVANAAAQPRRVRLFAALPFLLDGLPVIDLLGDLLDETRTLSWSQGCLDLPLDPHGVMWLKPKDAHPSGYRFFK